ncbi:MAG: hypothetical protein ACI4D4_00975 [Lachnospira sp.]
MEDKKKNLLSEIHYVKMVTIGSVNPNNLLSEQSREQQVNLLNRCLNDYPKGIIIGKDVTIGRYMIGEHELTMEKTTYHIGFLRKPTWEN